MAKRIIIQKRGHGGPTYRSPSHKFAGKPTHRPLDDKEQKGVINGTVKDIFKCPGHYAPLAVVQYETNQTGFIIAPEKLKVNQQISTGALATVKSGNTLPLKNIPEGTSIYNIETRPGDLGKLVRTSGGFAKVVSKLKNKITIKLPSQKRKEINPECRATIGVIAGSGRKEKPLYKAGRNYHKKKARNKLYPRTAAGAMNATDHPFGSGRGGPTYGGKHSSIAPKNSPPGRKVGMLRPKHTGRNK
ncbi:MAG: 50S ribosomal protein L2 [Nanoarchaeota archaeon]|nr:50S ribosomal protein L2 [Nanoarchaeota archaeon]|tara:strand:- start:30209 stop:30943 length:735 start_codon:yes stop_codon:yes gene_type:complete